MLRKSLAIIALSATAVLPALAGPPQPEAIISALESAYNVPKIFFTANTTENVSPLGAENAAEPQNYVQRYCRDGKKLDVSAEVAPAGEILAADAASQYERMVLTPDYRVSVRKPAGEEARPMMVKKAPDEEARGYARTLLHGGEALDGYLAADLEPVPQVLREAKSVKVRPDTELVGETPCVVVEATSKHGKYTLWLDKSDDATLRKAEVVKNNGDQYNSMRKLGKMTMDGTPVAQSRFTMDNVAVETIDGRAVPVSARLETTFTLSDGRTHTVSREHKRASLNLNPDFSAMDAFQVGVPANAIFTDKTAAKR